MSYYDPPEPEPEMEDIAEHCEVCGGWVVHPDHAWKGCELAIGHTIARTVRDHEVCTSCMGTGIGHPGADTECGDCRGTGNGPLGDVKIWVGPCCSTHAEVMAERARCEAEAAQERRDRLGDDDSSFDRLREGFVDDDLPF